MSEGAARWPFFFTWSRQRDARPLEITGGAGAWFETADGRRWLDLGSLVYQANAGHGHAGIIEAVQRQAADLCLSHPRAVYPAKIELAERLLAIAPEGFDRVFFTLGGSEAVENALKMARLFTGRSKLISRYRSYHGATMGALSLTGDWRRPPLEPGLWGVVHALDCDCARCPFGQQPASCHLECASHIDQLLELEGAGTVAAVVLESIPGANGVLVPPPGYWPAVREACDRDGALLVADEVLCGFGRTGRWFGFENFGVVPDLITVGKALTGGYGTLGAVLVHERVSRRFDDEFLYAGLTHYAHPLGCAAGAAALRAYEEEGLIAGAPALGAVLEASLGRLTEALGPRVRCTRHIGLLAAVELAADAAAWPRLAAALDARGVHAHLRERLGAVILAPPLCITPEELRGGVETLGEAIAEALPA